MGRRAAKPKDPKALTVAQRGILCEAAAMPSGRLVLRGSAPVSAGRRLAALGYMTDRHLAFHTGYYFDITPAGFRAIGRTPVPPTSLAPAKPSEPKCFACDGTGQRCNRCGETENACGCEEDFDGGPCGDCKGTGK